MREKVRSSCRRRALVAELCLGAALVTTAARAEPPAASAPSEAERPSFWVDFEAGKVTVDPDNNVLELERRVAIKVHRYRLTSERLRLERGPRGIVVDGDGRVAFCPCPDPPVTLGFSAATVAPPTDLLLEDPTLRVGGVPILWLPYLWLRAPDRLGVLPPRVAWRGDDGLLLGSGVHVPLGDLDAAGEADALDLYASGYLKGGVELDARTTTETTSTRVRFDHLEESLLAVDSRGALSHRTGATFGWRADAIRGERGRSGTLSLEEAARPWDRAEASVLGVQDGFVLGLGARAAALRGGELSEPGRAGPSAHTGFGSALGEIGAVDAALAVQSSDARGEEPASIAEQRAELSLFARPGPLGAELALGQGVLVDSRSQDAGVLGFAAARARLGLPLVREIGRRDPLVHRLEPFVRGGGRFVRRQGALTIADPLALESTASASAGIETGLGRYGARSGATLRVEGGAAAAGEALEPVASAQLIADAESFGFGSAAHATAGETDDERGMSASARARLGRVDALHVAASADGRAGADTSAARLLTTDFDGPLNELFDRPGLSVGGEIGVPLTVWLASAIGADYDLSADELTGVRGSIGYRHPCGCLAALAWAGHRLGRDGVDAWLTVDLLP